MRTQEEIKLIAEEIRLNVAKEIVREDRKRMVSKLKDYAYKHKDQLVSPMGIALMLGGIRIREDEIRAAESALRTRKAFSEYRKKVTERL